MSDDRKKFPNIFWPKIESKRQAESLIKIAAGYCIFISCMSLGASLLYKYQIVDIPYFQSAWMSAFIYTPLAYFLYEKEKIAAWATLIYYVFDQIYTMTISSGTPGFLMILVTCAFISAIRALRYLDKNSEPEHLQAKKEDPIAS